MINLQQKENLGEFIGTFALVFLGCGTVALAEIYGVLTALWQVSLCWGLAVAFSIFLVRKWCHAHFNPAVSLLFFLQQKITLNQLIIHSFTQLIGAFCAAIALYFIIQDELAFYELKNQLVRGETKAIRSAMVFGEFFPNPAFPTISISWKTAAFLEGLGTFVLCMAILLVLRIKKINRLINFLIPFIIGGTVSVIIYFIAPYTQAGINPARDLGPRLFSYFAGWDSIVFTNPGHSFLTVYVLSPMIGAFLSSKLYDILVKKSSDFI